MVLGYNSGTEGCKLKDFVFDMDGTLYDSTGVEIQAYQAAFPRAGYPMPEAEEIMVNVGPPANVMIGNLAGDHSEETVARLRAFVVEEELAAIRDCARTYPGIDELVRELYAAGARLYVCSNAGYEYVNALCDKFGLTPMCLKIVSSVPGKSKNELLADLKRDMGITEFAMVGDREYDVEAGRVNGGVTVGCTYGFADPACVKDADIICPTVAQLRRELLRLLNEA